MDEEGGGHQAEEALRPPNPRTTWEGCSVLLDINDGDRLVFARLSPAATLKIGNKKCFLSPLIGCPFGSLFRVDTGPNGPHLTRIASSSAPSHDNCMQESDDGQSIDELKDNRSLIDNNTAQNLSSDDIDAMRREGATGDEIVEALIANSSTFGTKTAFSQEKYKLKKQKKYAPKVLLRRPSTRSICETYFKKYPARIGFLRMDTLSLLLSMANVGAYSDILVVDMVGGLLTGAIAERLGGIGYICSTYFRSMSYPSDIVRMFNFNSETLSRIVQAPFSDLCSSENLDHENSKSHENIQSSEIQSQTKDSLLTECASKSSIALSEDPVVQEGDSLSDCRHGDNPSRGCKSVNPGRRASPELIKLWKEKGFSSLMIAAPELEVGSLVQDLLPLLSYSAPFAIYHQFLQPLATCMHRLQTSRMAINLQISEPWLREYQVLPARTHPMMQMSAFGGYILSGIRICGSEAGNGNN
ncbi:tRNA (adenine(58)-N(1))-methyltransferase non-catalytic subunit trm6-like [Phoenix dactylifera]|uniref:tRNA (adenine(58)-N(1))-methyltransferase non-catalytic subunit TRM6 n=1 Tax=Phoenix dactylifera TaxID=42345 RepID=A0A8B9A130_PHODC|nr:tRNA (adenine(58)-N(1))-methyltransferase non-catalytic subunit trm6-like [Phoenix dactylifera]